MARGECGQFGFIERAHEVGLVEAPRAAFTRQPSAFNYRLKFHFADERWVAEDAAGAAAGDAADGRIDDFLPPARPLRPHGRGVPAV